MTRETFGALAFGLFGLCACADRIPEPIVIPTTPHISWVITTEDSPANEEEVCRSDPRSPCVLPASAADTKRFATVHLYLHPATTDTKYTGTMHVKFFSGAESKGHEQKIDTTIKAGAPRYSISTTADVTTIPGSYDVRILLNAASTTQRSQHAIQDDIAVTAK